MFDLSPPTGYDLPSLCEWCIACWKRFVRIMLDTSVGQGTNASETQFVGAHGKKFAIQAFAVNPNGCMDLDFPPVSLRMGLDDFYDLLHRIFEGVCKPSVSWNTRCHNTTAPAANSGVGVVEIREPVSFPNFDVQLWFAAACFNDRSCGESFWYRHDYISPFLMAGNDFLPSVYMVRLAARWQVVHNARTTTLLITRAAAGRGCRLNDQIPTS